MKEAKTFGERASFIHSVITKNKGSMPSKIPAETEVTQAQLREGILQDMPSAIRELNSLRAGSNDRRAVEVSFGEYIQEKWGFTPTEGTGAPDTFLDALKVNPSSFTVEKLMTMPEMEEGYRWLVPEIIREAIRLGLRRSPIYSSLIAREETVTQPSVIMPHINMSDAMPKRLNEAESIPVGTVSFGQKTVKISKVGTGITLTDEIQQQVPLNLLAIYLQDVGVKLNLALDSLAVNTLINGEQDNGSQSAPVIGVESTDNGITYYDLLRAWIKLGILGKTPSGILSNEGPALDILQLPEFKGFNGTTTTQKINLQTPVPASQNYWVHGAMPSANQIMLVDTSNALIKLNLNSLKVENERIVSRQLEGTYVTVTTGFATLFRDARLIIDKSIAFSGNGYPTWLNAGEVQKQMFK